MQTAWGSLGLNGLQPARVIADFGTSVKIATPNVARAELSGKLAHYSTSDETPKVGDWVAVRILESGIVVESVVLRSNELTRKVVGKRALKQIFAANVDIAFVLLSLDEDFSLERLERFLFQLSVQSIEPIIILNKADKTDDLQSFLSQLEIFEVPIIVTVATEESDFSEIETYIKPGCTAILLGSSGVGKSTLTNKLLGRQAQQTDSVRLSDSMGKHTTVHRELFTLPGGGLLIDTPGIRELQLWGTEQELDTKFDDIIQLTSKCEYHNCSHTQERGCAIHKSLANGTLDKKYYASYLKMKSELLILSSRNAEKNQRMNRRVRKVDNRRDRFFTED